MALAPRERQVVELIQEGLTNREIASKMKIAIGTVKSYTNRIYGKLGVSNRTGAAMWAAKKRYGLPQADKGR